MKPTTVLASGTLKIITPDADALTSNAQRARNYGETFKAAWNVVEVNDAGEVVGTHRVADFSPRTVTVQYDPRGLRAVYPNAKPAIRASEWLSGFWLETREELELYGKRAA